MRLLVLAAAGLALAPTARAQAARPLAHQVQIDLPVTALLGAAWIATEVPFKSALAPATCRWCDRGPGGEEALNPLDAAGRTLRWSSPGAADALSNVVAFALLPGAVLGLNAAAAIEAGAPREGLVDALLVLEAAVAAAAINQAVKFAAGRERPFVHAMSEEARRLAVPDSDWNLSFYSGHASFAFALAASSATVAHLRGHRLEPWVWALGLSLAAAVGYLRIAADKHYLIDVLVGASLGAAVGWAMPFLFHRPAEQPAAT